jgi:methylase of polypeptide subunit release factors
MIYQEFEGVDIESPLGVSPVGGDTRLLASEAAGMPFGSALEIGTGTGFVPIFLARQGRHCDGCDINDFALVCARKNAIRNNVHCHFFRSNLYSGVDRKYDLVLFNPPLGSSGSHRFIRILELIKSVIPKENDLFIKLSYALVKHQRVGLIRRFFHDSPAHLVDEGRILIFLYPPELTLVDQRKYRILGEFKGSLLLKICPCK